MTAPDTRQENRSPMSGRALRTTGAIGSAALVLMAANLSGSILGFLRLAVIVAVYGERQTSAAFVAASLIPQMFYDLTVGAAVSAALIPTFTEIVGRRGTRALADTVGAVLGLAWCVLLAVTAILFFAVRPVMTALLVLNSGSGAAAGVDQTVFMARIIIFSLFFLGTSAILLSTLYAVRRFPVPAFAAGLYHVGVIGGAVLLVRPLGAAALPVGAILGSAAQTVVQIPVVVRHIGRPHIRLALTPEVRRILRLYGPVAGGLVVSIVGQAIDLRFKWKLGYASYIALQAGTALTQFPIGIAVAGLSFAILPSISADVAFERHAEFKQTLAFGLRVVLFLTIPAAVGYIILATPIAALTLQRAHVTSADSIRTGLALTGYAIQIPFVGIDQLLIFAFYARKNTLTPMLIGILGVGIYIVSALILAPRYHVLGLALANTLQNSVHAVILLVLMGIAVGVPRGTGMLDGLLRTSIAAATMALVAAGALAALRLRLAPTSFDARLLEGLVPIAAGFAAYLAVARALGSAELSLLTNMMSSRLRGGHTPTDAPC